jgi:uncharacterized protein (DUF1778 family)
MPTKAKLKTAPKRTSKPAKLTRAKRRSARIEARITPENLTVIKRAAEIQGRSVSDFIVAAAQEAAHRAIEKAHLIRLTVEQHRQFMEAINNPPPLTPAMERAIERHRRLIGEP